MTRAGRGCDAASTLHLAYSFACDLSCGHCIFESGPDEHRTLGLGPAKKGIDQAASAGIQRIVLTGGEPLVHAREIRVLIHYATERGLECTLVSNASWAVSERRALDTLAELKTLGLRSLTLSTDRYHLTGVPLEHLRWALEAARELHIGAAVKVSRLAGDPIAEGLCRALRNTADRILVQDIAPLGRAASLRGSVRLRPFWRFNTPGCATPPLLLPNGNLLTCCNLPAREMGAEDFPFVLGNIREESLATLLGRRAADPLLAALRSHGPGALLPVAARKVSGTATWGQTVYHSGCDLCFKLFCRMQDKRPLYASAAGTDRMHDQSLGVAR